MGQNEHEREEERKPWRHPSSACGICGREIHPSLSLSLKHTHRQKTSGSIQSLSVIQDRDSLSHGEVRQISRLPSHPKPEHTHTHTHTPPLIFPKSCKN